MKLAVIDLETDPFEHNKMVWPFVGGFYDGERFISWWNPRPVEQMVKFLEKEKEQYVIYAHNGGRFDFFYFLSDLSRNMRIINGRIIQATLGKHELRDSFAIMPFALSTYKKTDIDYTKFVASRRETHRNEIINYLHDDCVDLYTLCAAFRLQFGDALTIGSAALKELKKFHPFSTGAKSYDQKFRERFYFGGRCQTFKSGVIDAPVKVYDINSQYPHVMANYLHPLGTQHEVSKRIEKNTIFIVVEGKNHGAFPIRLEDGSLDFNSVHGIFNTTIHEFRAAIDTGTFQPIRILKTYGFKDLGVFDTFVTHFYDAKRTAKVDGDKIKEIFYKYILNSAYGKFAQNPERYYDWAIAKIGTFPEDWHECRKSCPTGGCRLKWSPAWMGQGYIIWQRPLKREFYYNIAIGASITSAARAQLLKGLTHATNPYYCDTDSIICESLTHVPVDNFALGAWKLEATGCRIAIAGKKLYAIFDEAGNCIKKAHKGALLTGEQIVRVAQGETLEYRNPVPNFKFDGTWGFTKRRIRRTA